MGKYSIKDLEQLSGIKAHTLRVWEQRYNIIAPKRTHTNIRYYDDADLQLILNISFLNRNGEKISRIARMSSQEISQLVRKISDSNLEYPNQVNALVIAMVNLDEDRFEKIISTNTLQFGFEATMLNIVYPFLAQIGIMWQTGSVNPAHEHFITNLIRQKLIVAIDGQSGPVNPYAKKWALYLPEGELHELTMLFSAYIIKSRHNKVIYLGQSLPLRDLGTMCDVYKPDFILTVITSYPTRDELQPYLLELKRKAGPACEIVISGHQPLSNRERVPDCVNLLESIPDLISYVEANSERPFAYGLKTA